MNSNFKNEISKICDEISKICDEISKIWDFNEIFLSLIKIFELLIDFLLKKEWNGGKFTSKNRKIFGKIK